MKKSLRISLKGGERIFVNGAVLRVDRKVSVEFLNDVRFLLEGHVLQADETATPLRQLYFFVQTMLIDPPAIEAARDLYRQAMLTLAHTIRNPDLLIGLVQVAQHVDGDKLYDALRALRGLFALEAAILGGGRDLTPTLTQSKEIQSCR